MMQTLSVKVTTSALIKFNQLVDIYGMSRSEVMEFLIDEKLRNVAPCWKGMKVS